MDYIEEIISLKEQMMFHGEIRPPTGFDNIVIAGMGGSGIAGKIFRDIYSVKPVTLVESHKIPDFVDSNTLFIAISYSGNTEETLSALEAAKNKGAKIESITSGGKLASIVPEAVIVPKGYQPRSAIGYLTLPLLKGFGLVGKVEIEEAVEEINKIDTDTSTYREIAEKLFSTRSIPVIYGTHPLGSLAYRWKTQFNENSKILSYSGEFPELNHNDTMALEKTYRKDEFYFFVLTHKFTDNNTMNRIGITSELSNIRFSEIKGEGDSLLSNLFTIIHKGDYISYFLATLRKTDPKDVSIIEDLKKRLNETI